MEQLILIRYGEHKDGHLSEQGTQTMRRAADSLLRVNLDKVRLLAANTPRAIESARIIASSLSVEVEVFDELYAAEEDGKLPDPITAWNLLQKLGTNYDSVIVVLSREYIETLPSTVLKQELTTSLERGECLIIDLVSKTVSYA